jgi:beta-galactosidase
MAYFVNMLYIFDKCNKAITDKMKALPRLTAIMILSLSAAAGLAAQETNNDISASSHTVATREIISLDADWRFQLGVDIDAKPASTIEDWRRQPDTPVNLAYDDHAWQHVDVPHDYVIDGPFDTKVDKGVDPEWYKHHGYHPLKSAWYRKAIYIPGDAKGRKMWLEFDGVFSNSRYWLNGRELGGQYSGYSSFRFDITDVARYGEENVLTVHVDPRYDGWWYEGGGIYRHVRLVTLDPVHIAPWGVFVAPLLNDPADGIRADAKVVVTTEAANQSDVDVTATVLSEVIDKSGKVVAADSAVQSLRAGAKASIVRRLPLEKAILWSLENPYLYRLRSTVSVSGRAVDQVATSFGVRHIRFDADHGFFLNGKPVKIKGVNCHQDHAGVGVAMPDRLMEWRLERLKEMGCNGLRCSHNPVAPELLDFCDRLGILVIAENRHLGDTYADQSPENTPAVEHRDLTTLVMRDRNHPSIILWSLCNEQWIQGSAAAAAMAKAMKQRIYELDGTRPVTAAMNGSWNSRVGFPSVLDVVGFNYNPEGYQKFHTTFPAKPMIATEIASELCTRGVYEMDHWENYWGNKDRGHFVAYSINIGGNTVEDAWGPVAENEYMAGGFVWTGFDYKGEPRPLGWPCINSHYGFMDICGFPKDSYYYYKAWWTDEPVLHVFPHWNWPGKEGQEIPVWVHSNCQQVELFLNGVSQGKQTVKPHQHLQWKVKYAPGTLVAKGIRDGKPIETTVETTGDPAEVRLTADRTTLMADNNDVAVITVKILDTEGRLAPVADNEVTFTLTGPGKLIGVGNGDCSCHEPDKENRRSAFNGLAQAIVQTTTASGNISLKAEAAGLKSGTVTLTSK